MRAYAVEFGTQVPQLGVHVGPDFDDQVLGFDLRLGACTATKILPPDVDTIEGATAWIEQHYT